MLFKLQAPSNYEYQMNPRSSDPQTAFEGKTGSRKSTSEKKQGKGGAVVPAPPPGCSALCPVGQSKAPRWLAKQPVMGTARPTIRQQFTFQEGKAGYIQLS
jgi:hypothetical protein